MGTGELKQELREKIIGCQYHKMQGDIRQLLDVYDRCLEDWGNSDELAEAAFLRGEAAFRMGRYHDTVKALTTCLSMEKSPECAYLEADAYNMLGMLFSFVGYEDIALDNYLSAIASAQKSRNLQGEVSALLNAGLLYQGLSDYKRAMSYYKRAHQVADSENSSPDILLILICMIQEAQLLFRMGRYEEVKKMRREIDTYDRVVAHGEKLLPKCILEVWLEARFGAEDRVEAYVEEIRQFLAGDANYLEQIDFYVEFCEFLMSTGRKLQARQFLDILIEKLGTTEFLRLRVVMEEMEVQYQKTYSDEAHYRRACLHYLELQEEYQHVLREFKRKNLNNIKSLQEIEQQRREFEFRSKRDLATGLFNKDTFQYEVERYLCDRNRDVMDALIVIDIDDFKLVNDRFGHLMGDEVIVKLATATKERFSEDLCGRFGGDEFVVFVRDIKDMEGLEACIERFREEFGGIGFGRNGDVHNTISIGVSYNRGINASYNTMFACADEALMKAKEYGKNRVTFFEIKRGILKYVGE